MEYGMRIKEFRERAGLTQAQLAKRAGVTQAHISLIESGSVRMTVKTADKIAGALGVTLNKLFEEE